MARTFRRPQVVAPQGFGGLPKSKQARAPCGCSSTDPRAGRSRRAKQLRARDSRIPFREPVARPRGTDRLAALPTGVARVAASDLRVSGRSSSWSPPAVADVHLTAGSGYVWAVLGRRDPDTDRPEDREGDYGRRGPGRDGVAAGFDEVWVRRRPDRNHHSSRPGVHGHRAAYRGLGRVSTTSRPAPERSGPLIPSQRRRSDRPVHGRRGVRRCGSASAHGSGLGVRCTLGGEQRRWHHLEVNPVTGNVTTLDVGAPVGPSRWTSATGSSGRRRHGYTRVGPEFEFVVTRPLSAGGVYKKHGITSIAASAMTAGTATRGRARSREP
jgi:hypothetical protein